MGGGGGGGGHHNRNRGPRLPNIPEGFFGSIDMNKNKFKNLNPHRQKRMIGAYTVPEAGGTPPEDKTTGPGSGVFNSAQGAVPGALGLAAQGGLQINTNFPTQNQFYQDQASQEYNDFLAYKNSTPGLGAEYTWTTYLQGKYGPDLPAGMARAQRERFARASPTARGYFSDSWRGPGRTITG
jgi:hypothetical protein